MQRGGVTCARLDCKRYDIAQRTVARPRSTLAGTTTRLRMNENGNAMRHRQRSRKLSSEELHDFVLIF